MKCVCRMDCQIRLEDGHKVVKKGGKITFVEEGRAMDLDKCPPTFESLESAKYIVDFETASEQELLKAKWTVAEAKAAVKDLFDYDLKIAAEDTKRDIVKAILDIRYRTADV